MRIARGPIEEELRATWLPVFSEPPPNRLIRLKEAITDVYRYALEEFEERQRRVTRPTAERWLDDVRDLERSERFVLYRGELSPTRLLLAPWLARYFGCAVGSMNDYCPETEQRLSSGRLLVFGRLHRALALELVWSVACSLVDDMAREYRRTARHTVRRNQPPLGKEQALETLFLQRMCRLLDVVREYANVEKRISALQKEAFYSPDVADGFGVEGDFLLAARAAGRRAIIVDKWVYLYGWKDFINAPADEGLDEIAFL